MAQYRIIPVPTNEDRVRYLARHPELWSMNPPALIVELKRNDLYSKKSRPTPRRVRRLLIRAITLELSDRTFEVNQSGSYAFFPIDYVAGAMGQSSPGADYWMGYVESLQPWQAPILILASLPYRYRAAAFYDARYLDRKFKRGA